MTAEFSYPSTMEDICRPAMTIKTQKEADDYMEGVVQYGMKHEGWSREKAIRACLSNLHYYAGHYGDSQVVMVNTFFKKFEP